MSTPASGRRSSSRFACVALAVLFVLFRPFVIVPAGHRAVIFSLTSGVLKKQCGEGFHFIVPVVHRPFLYDVRTQTYSMSRTHWEGEAEAIELKGKAVAENAKVVQYDYVRKIAPNVKTIITDGKKLPLPAATGQ